MIKLVYSFCFVVLVGTSYAQKLNTDSLIHNEINRLIETKDFFNARIKFEKNGKQLSEKNQLIIAAYIDNAFNLPAESNEKINKLMTQYFNDLNDTLRYELLNLTQINYSRLYEYRKAHEAANEVLAKYSSVMTEDEIDDFKNTNIIWKVLCDQPKQTVNIKGSTLLKMEKDKAGLSNLNTECGNEKINFIFDTGANLSTVTASTASKYKMIIMKDAIDVTSITGNKIKAQIAVCPEFTIGNITVNNAIFIVFPDSALAIPQINYQINGIIGFPVIEAFKEIQITKKGEFIVPDKTTDLSLRNMALDFLTPVIQLNGESYSFDSGADATMLYSPYFEKYKTDITGNYEEVDYQFGGVGGAITKKGYSIPFKTELCGKQINLKDVVVLTENHKGSENYYYGNIGQDLIKKYDKMILNFQHMYIGFE